jgi:hypothetical protein
MADNHAAPNHESAAGSTAPAERLLTVDEIILELSFFTTEQRALAWSPEPPFASTGPHDCRMGGNCGLDFNRETRHARWLQSRHRWNREQKKLQASLPLTPCPALCHWDCACKETK